MGGTAAGRTVDGMCPAVIVGGGSPDDEDKFGRFCDEVIDGEASNSEPELQARVGVARERTKR